MNSEEFFESIEIQFKNELPFVAYRKPNVDSLNAILQKDSGLYFTNNFKETGFVFAPFDDKGDAVLIPAENSEVLSSNLVIPAKAGIYSNKVIESDNEIPAFAGMTKHINLVQKGIDAIKDNRFKKVVLSRKEIISNLENNSVSIFKKLLNTYSSAFVYIWYHPKVGLWLGATPETLLKVEGNRFYTIALAGTQTYNGTLDVKWNKKEKEEQQIVTDYIVNNIKDMIDDLKVSEVETIKAGSLLHLKSKISGSLKSNSNNLQLLTNILHPTPAVCGVPKEGAKQFILKYENYNREFYTGFLGEIGSDNSSLYVNLRCIQLKNDKAILYIGGGITTDSNPESEWQETLNKAQIIKSVL